MNPPKRAQKDVDARWATKNKETHFRKPFFVTERDAIVAAKRLVLEYLKAPSTATFHEEAVIENRSPQFIVHLVVDAQNSYGAFLRNSYLCYVLMEDKGTFRYNVDHSIEQTEGRVPTELEILIFKDLNHW